MPVAFDAASTASTSTRNYSWTHTPVGVPTAVVVGIGSLGLSQPLSVGYGGRKCTFIITTAIASQTRVSVYLCTDPPPGPQLVTVNLAATQEAASIAMSATGAGTEGPSPPNSNGDSNDFDTPPITTTVTSATNRMVFSFVASGSGGVSTNTDAQVTPGAGQTQQASVSAPTTDQPRFEGMTEAGAASVVTDATFTNQADWSIAGVSIDGIRRSADPNPVTGGVPVPHLLGV